jgi:hypothetical protein
MFKSARRATATIAAALAALLALGAPAAMADITAPEQLLMDTQHAPNTGFAGPVSTSDILTAGRYYGIQAQGTYSAFLPNVWARANTLPRIVCGAPEALPTLPSPGRATALAGQDVEVIFARPWFAPCPHALPATLAPLFQMDTGSGFSHVVPNGGPFTTPQPNHSYTYLVRGQGAIASFRIGDSNTVDNNGILQIAVRPATVSDCAGNTDCLSQVQPQTASSAAANTTLTLPSNKSCVSRRRFTLHVVTHRKDPVTRATILLNGKALKVLRKRGHGLLRLSAVVDLRKRPLLTLRILITARTRKGRIIVGRRTYHTCAAKRPSKKAPPL